MGKKVVVAGLRTADCAEEMFAIVVKMFGNGMCEVSCADGVNRMCIIRKKFRGRGKHGNVVSVGTTIMIGLRTWEKNDRSALAKCDLLEVYAESELRKLKQRGALNLDKASRVSVVTEAEEIEFSTGVDGEYDGDDNHRVGSRNGSNDEVSRQPERDYDLSMVSDDDDESDDSDYVNVDDI